MRGLAARVARLAEGRQERRQVVGRDGPEHLLHHRLDEVRARRADDRPRDPLGAVLVGGSSSASPAPQPQEGRLGVEVAADVRQALGDL